MSYVVAPLIWPRAFGIGVAQTPAAPVHDEIETLALLRDDLLAQIVDLDFEQAVGKTDEEEYQQERAALKRRALAVIRSLDERTQSEVIEESIEREISRARARRVEATTARRWRGSERRGRAPDPGPAPLSRGGRGASGIAALPSQFSAVPHLA